ncbi:MAG TPA: hypothetical protein VKR83_18265 [Ktedonobacteraceae bacterium]|nr:hypothetical protein [Ktedonobacteraceae bacterium]
MSTRFHNKSLLHSLGVAFLGVLLIASTLLVLAHSSKSTAAHATSSGFSFTAAGDYGQTNDTTDNLNYIAHSGASFNLGLGDFNYDTSSTASAWSTYAKSLLPANFPFEIIPGDHDASQMSTYEAELPNQMAGMSGTYGAQYYFDYPPVNPLARIIMISPSNLLPGYNYDAGSADYNWVSNTIDAARAANIPWVIVGMYEYCFAIGNANCYDQQLLDLLLNKHVDLILQAHKHNYQRSKQLALNSTSCPTLNTTTYNASCVVNDTDTLTQGAGSVIVVTGTGGTTPLLPITTDPKMGYYKTWMGTNLTWGVSKFTVSAAQLSMQYVAVPGGAFSDSFTITNGSVTPTPTTSSTATSTPPPPPLQTGPVSKSWYFAEGRVGGGFNEYLSMDNPTANDCSVAIEYLYTPDGHTPLTKQLKVNIPAHTRAEEGVDGDLGTSSGGFGITDSAILTVDNTATPNCTGIVAERPMYFNALGVNSGSDVLGVTSLATSFYLADVAVGTQASGGAYSSFLPILNPPGSPGAASVTATYYAGGKQVGQQSTTVAVGTRGTIFPSQASPALPAHVAVVVTSTEKVAVERPTYFSNINAGNAGTVSGGADVIGVQALSSDWLFAEGYTGGQFQEYFAIANLDSKTKATAAVSIKLETSSGAVNTFTLSVPTLGQVLWNVNTSAPNAQVSAEISATGAKIVVEREMFFHYSHQANGRSLSATGGSDALGQPGPAAKTLYSFAEGYTNVDYDEWLTLQNPTANTETITITLYNALGQTYSTPISVGKASRATVDIVGMVLQHLYQSADGFKGFEVSMTVQTTTAGAVFVAERPMYWNASGTQGGSAIIGYTGG